MLLNDAVSNKMLHGIEDWKGRRSWLVSRYYPGFRLERHWNTTKIINPNSLEIGRESNRIPSEHNCIALPLCHPDLLSIRFNKSEW